MFNLEWGNIADWLGAIGTIGAVWFSLWILLKDEKIKLHYYIYNPVSGPFKNLNEYERHIEKRDNSKFVYYDGCTTLCVANKSEFNIQLKVDLLRILNLENEKAIYETDFINILVDNTTFDTGYVVLPSGQVTSILLLDSNNFYQNYELPSRFEIEITIDYLDKGRETIIIGSRTGSFTLLPKASVSIPLG